jgi:hypothetical protein
MHQLLEVSMTIYDVRIWLCVGLLLGLAGCTTTQNTSAPSQNTSAPPATADHALAAASPTLAPALTALTNTPVPLPDANTSITTPICYYYDFQYNNANYTAYILFGPFTVSSGSRAVLNATYLGVVNDEPSFDLSDGYAYVVVTQTIGTRRVGTPTTIPESDTDPPLTVYTKRPRLHTTFTNASGGGKFASVILHQSVPPTRVLLWYDSVLLYQTSPSSIDPNDEYTGTFSDVGKYKDVLSDYKINGTPHAISSNSNAQTAEDLIDADAAAWNIPKPTDSNP